MTSDILTETFISTDQWFPQNREDLESDHKLLIPMDMNEKPETREEIAEIIYKRYSSDATFIQKPRNAVKVSTCIIIVK